MVYKPLEEGTYRKYIRLVGWELIKGKIDYKLMDENDNFICVIKIAHGIPKWLQKLVLGNAKAVEIHRS